MSRKNEETVIVNWNEPAPVDEEQGLDVLTRAYAELGKAFYEYRFEEPTPELLLLFDKITTIRNSDRSADQYEEKKQNHIEPMNYYEQMPEEAEAPIQPEPVQPSSPFLSSLSDLPDIGDEPTDYLGATSFTPDSSSVSASSRFCSNCGAPADPDSVFCGNCGSRLD